MVVDGLMYGVHRSRVPGAGLEFSQYRSYQPGDDLRRIDWKLLGRSDRYFVRESEIETSVTIRLVVDASASMAHAEDGVAKLDYARMLAAALTVLGTRQGDAVGLHALGEGGVRTVPARRDHQHVHRILHELGRLRPGGRWPEWGRVEGIFTAGGTRGITILISDLHEHADEIRTVAAKLAALRHDVLVLHLVGRRELEFGYSGAVAFEDLETGHVVEVDAATARDAYLAAQAEAHAATRRALDERGIDYARFTLDQPLDEALRAYLVARRRTG